MIDPAILSEDNTWLRYSSEDLDEARRMLRRKRFVPRHACFLAQQSTEKALKTVLIYCQVDFPWRHDLEVLAALIPPGWSCGERDENLADLTEWAVESRYPGDMPDAQREDAFKAVKQASQVYRSVLKDLQKRGVQPPSDEN
jgi:HEPN domain-containing protein